MVLFIALAYAPTWLSASQAVDAPVNDLLLLKQYRTVDSQIAEAALPVIRRPLRYPRPPTVVFAVFSDSVENAVKQEMAEKLTTLSEPGAFLHDNVAVDEKTRLPDLVDQTSCLIFSRLLLHPAWLSPPAAEWGEDPDYREEKRVIEGLKVTNDVAERWAKLIQDIASSVTAEEGQLQKLLQVVERHRKEVTGFSKSSLAKLK